MNGKRALARLLCLALALFLAACGSGEQKLAAPGLLEIRAEKGGVRLEWAAPEGAEEAFRYRVLRRAGDRHWVAVAETTEQSFLDKDSSDRADYSYSVCAISMDGKRVISLYDRQGLTLNGQEAPVLRRCEYFGGAVRLGWFACGGAEQYRVLRRTEGESWTALADIAGLSFADESAQSGMTYAYSVCALNADGEPGAFDDSGLTVTCTEVLLPTPVLESVTNTGSGVALRWGAVDGAEKYRVFRSEAGAKWKRLAVTEEPFCEDASAVSGVTYSYTVRCVSADGTYFTSDYDRTGLTILCTGGQLPAPALVSCVYADGAVTFAWQAVEGAGSYRVYRRESGGKWQKLADVNGTEYRDASAASGVSYDYSARCLSETGEIISNYDRSGLTVTVP